MKSATAFYLCRMCFKVSETEVVCHDHPMVLVDPGEEGDERRKPLLDEEGRLKSQAPRWFLEALGFLLDDDS